MCQSKHIHDYNSKINTYSIIWIVYGSTVYAIFLSHNKNKKNKQKILFCISPFKITKALFQTNTYNLYFYQFKMMFLKQILTEKHRHQLFVRYVQVQMHAIL
jgi:hypothetical protein